MKPRLRIEFGPSRGANYADAVRLAKKHVSYIEVSPGRHRITLSGNEVLFALPLADLARGWRSTRIRVNGRIVPASRYWKLLDIALRDLPYCYTERGGECKGVCLPLRKAKPKNRQHARLLVLEEFLDLCPAFRWRHVGPIGAGLYPPPPGLPQEVRARVSTSPERIIGHMGRKLAEEEPDKPEPPGLRVIDGGKEDEP